MLSNSSITGERGAETPCPTLTSFLRHATKVADNPFDPASSTGTPPDCINSDSKRDPPLIPIYSDGAPLVRVVRNNTTPRDIREEASTNPSSRALDRVKTLH